MLSAARRLSSNAGRFSFRFRLNCDGAALLDRGVEALQAHRERQRAVARQRDIGVERVVAEVFERLERKAETRLGHHRRRGRPFVDQGAARRPRGDRPVVDDECFAVDR